MKIERYYRHPFRCGPLVTIFDTRPRYLSGDTIHDSRSTIEVLAQAFDDITSLMVYLLVLAHATIWLFNKQSHTDKVLWFASQYMMGDYKRKILRQPQPRHPKDGTNEGFVPINQKLYTTILIAGIMFFDQLSSHCTNGWWFRQCRETLSAA